MRGCPTADRDEKLRPENWNNKGPLNGEELIGKQSYLNEDTWRCILIPGASECVVKHSQTAIQSRKNASCFL